MASESAVWQAHDIAPARMLDAVDIVNLAFQGIGFGVLSREYIQQQDIARAGAARKAHAYDAAAGSSVTISDLLLLKQDTTEGDRTRRIVAEWDNGDVLELVVDECELLSEKRLDDTAGEVAQSMEKFAKAVMAILEDRI